MGRSRGVVTFALAVVVAISAVVVAPLSAETGAVGSAETPDGTETATPTETTPTPDDGPDVHADDPFPRWLPVAFAGALAVGIAAVGGGLWVVYVRVRRFLGR